MTGEENDTRDFILGLGSGLPTQWRQLLYRRVQAFVTKDKEEYGTASSAVSLRGLDLCRIVYGYPDLHSFTGGALPWHAGLRYFLDVRGPQR